MYIIEYIHVNYKQYNMWVKIYTFDNSNGEKIWENLPKNPIWQWLMYKRIYMGLNGVSINAWK